MSNPCEILEDTATAASSITAIDVIVLASGGANATDQVVVGTTQNVASAANAADTVTQSSFATVIDSANAGDSAAHTLTVVQALSDLARSQSRLYVVETISLQTSAQGTGTATAELPPTYVQDSASAADTISNTLLASVALANTAQAASFVAIGLAEAVASDASAADSAVATRTAQEAVSSAANGAVLVSPSATVRLPLLADVANGGASVTLFTATSIALADSALGGGSIWARNPDVIAWVMNTESMAAHWYANFEFQSIAQIGEKVFAVTEDGLYELTGDTDAGSEIPAQVQYGFDDFKVPQRKRMDGVYVGYSATGSGLQLTVEAREVADGAQTYAATVYDATGGAPRNTRFKPGKGMSGRYWRLTFENIAGANFSVTDIQADVAISQRRV